MVSISQPVLATGTGFVEPQRHSRPEKQPRWLKELKQAKPIAHREPKIQPWGVDCRKVEAHWRDERSGEWEQGEAIKVVVCPPYQREYIELASMGLQYQGERGTYAWSAKRMHPAIACHCMIDLIYRASDLSIWPEPELPVCWGLKRMDAAANLFARIEDGQYNFFDIKKDYDFRCNYDLPTARHQLTPYDYEWQTNRTGRDAAKALWNSRLKKIDSGWRLAHRAYHHPTANND